MSESVPLPPRDRPWPNKLAPAPDTIVAFLEFLNTTCINKLAGLSEDQARQTPIASSPVMSPLGIIKHLTAVQRQHIQIHIGRQDLPLLWSHEDTTLDFRIEPGESIATIIAAFDAEWGRSRRTIATISNWDATVISYGQPVRISRVLIDVLQETARHTGHLDILRELIDGETGE